MARSSVLVRIKGGDGTVVHVDLAGTKLTAAQRLALAALRKAGTDRKLTKEQLIALRSAKATIGEAAGEGPICRFDLKCIKINRSSQIGQLLRGR